MPERATRIGKFGQNLAVGVPFAAFEVGTAAVIRHFFMNQSLDSWSLPAANLHNGFLLPVAIAGAPVAFGALRSLVTPPSVTKYSGNGEKFAYHLSGVAGDTAAALGLVGMADMLFGNGILWGAIPFATLEYPAGLLTRIIEMKKNELVSY